MTYREDSLSRWISVSGVAHLIVLAGFLIKEAVVPSTPRLIPPTLRVDLVGLPEIVKKDLPQIAPPPPSEMNAPEKSAAAPPQEDVKPEEMVLKPKEKAKESKSKADSDKAKKEKEKDREKRLSNALAKIRSLERLKGEERTAREESALIKGNQISRGSSLSGEARESAEAGYYDRVREVLNSNWSIPAWLSRQKYSAQVQIRISGDGRISGIRFTKTSGNEQFDTEVRNTIQASQPLPPPPDEVAGVVSAQGLLVGFPL